MADRLPEPEIRAVEYEIVGASEHSGSYVAANIHLDKPQDQTSRWSGAIAPANSRQWIRLRLKHLTVLSWVACVSFTSLLAKCCSQRASPSERYVRSRRDFSHPLTHPLLFCNKVPQGYALRRHPKYTNLKTNSCRSSMQHEGV